MHRSCTLHFVASITKTPHGTYQVRWRDARGAQVALNFPKYADAKDWRDKMDGERVAGGLLNVAGGKQTMAEWGERWLSQVGVSERTAREYRSKFELYVVPMLGHRAIREVDRALCGEFVAEMTEAGYAVATIKYALSVLKGILDLAIEHKAIPADNPAARVKLPPLPQLEKRFLTRPQVEYLADKVERGGLYPAYGTLIRVAAFTGLRAGELERLRVCDVDLDERKVVVLKSKNYRSRTVPFPKSLVDPLMALAEDRGQQAPLFTTSRGSRLQQPAFYRRHFVPAAERCGLEGLRFHDLRHTYAALMIAAGAPPLMLMRFMGHSSTRVTLDVYGHLWPEMGEQIVDSLTV